MCAENKQNRATPLLGFAAEIINKLDYDCSSIGDDGDVATFTADLSLDYVGDLRKQIGDFIKDNKNDRERNH